MRQSVLLIVVALSLAFAPAPLPRNRTNPRLLAGKWVVKFTNGVVQTCELRTDGMAFVAEPARSSGGRTQAKGNAVVITFNDDRVERWSVRGTSVAVEHWFPASRYPSGPSVRGIAQRLP
jgi:hypothetical protein